MALQQQIQGQRAATIDELPLEWFFSDGVVLDLTGKADGEKIEVSGFGDRVLRHRVHPQAARHRAHGTGRDAFMVSPIMSGGAVR